MNSSGVQKIWFTPVVSPFLKQRRETLVLMGLGAVQVGLVYAHLPGWPCPFKAVFGIPCPGCGLSTACSLLLHGQWAESLQTHAFAPIFLLGLLFISIICFLPDKTRTIMINLTARFESHTGFMAWLMLFLFLYWGLRLSHLV